MKRLLKRDEEQRIAEWKKNFKWFLIFKYQANCLPEAVKYAEYCVDEEAFLRRHGLRQADFDKMMDDVRKELGL